jgi:hypothetical protein
VWFCSKLEIGLTVRWFLWIIKLSDDEENFVTIKKIESGLGNGKSPVSVGSMFLLVTASGILAACYRYIGISLEQGVSTEVVVGVIGGSTVLGLIIGIVLAILHSNSRWLFVVLAALLGAVFGLLVLVRAEHHGGIFFTAYTGSYILIVLMLAAARRPFLREEVAITKDESLDS